MKKTAQGSVRIISGTLKGSKLPVLDSVGLRPSADRVRETVFNWLQHSIQDRSALDLFAGSGALGFEAASRAAKRVVLVEHNPAAVELLKASKARLKIDNTDIIQADALMWLARQQNLDFDLVFLDPPFALACWNQLWPLLIPHLTTMALLYLEFAVGKQPTLPDGLQVLKQGSTRHSQFLLAQWQKPDFG